MGKEKQKEADKYQRKYTERRQRKVCVHFAQKTYHIFKNVCDVIMD